MGFSHSKYRIRRGAERIGRRRRRTTLANKLKTSGSDCAGEVEKLTGDADDFEQLKVTDVTVTGNTATAKVKARRGDDKNASTTFSLVKEDGDWRLSSLGAS